MGGWGNFDKLSSLNNEIKIIGTVIYIYNVDETGLAMVNKSDTITAPKGCKMVIMKKG